jgi:hypothetical protein
LPHRVVDAHDAIDNRKFAMETEVDEWGHGSIAELVPFYHPRHGGVPQSSVCRRAAHARLARLFSDNSFA